MTRIILDPGSCHMGDLSRAKALIKICFEVGADAIKFQLIPESKVGPNQYLPFEWFPELVAYGKDMGIEVFGSVWDQAGIDTLRSSGCTSIKFAYSQRKSERILETYNAGFFDTLFVSTDILDPVMGSSLIKLWCIPQYPVPFQVSFEGIFDRMDGFSDHTLGVKQSVRAIEAGCSILEKHFRLGDAAEQCPDAMFAITPKEANKLCKIAKI